MVLKFHMQPAQTAGLKNGKFSFAADQRWPLIVKMAKSIQSTFSPEARHI